MKSVSQKMQVPLHDKKQVLPDRKKGPHEKLLIMAGGLWYDLVSI